MNLYEAVQEIVKMLREGSRDFEAMLKLLEAQGMSRKEAQKLLDRLTQQVDEE